MTGYEIYKTVQYVSATNNFMECSHAKLDPFVCFAYFASTHYSTFFIDVPSYWLPFSSYWAAGMNTQSYTLALLPLIWGTLLSLGLGAIPWGVFYLVRWIAWGFKEH